MVTAQPTAPPPTERRVAARRQPTVGTVCQLTSPAGQHLIGLVWNISTSGISMLVHQRLKPGATVAAELKTANDRVVLPVTLRVAHVAPLRTGDYIVGGSFARPLDLEEMRQFLAGEVVGP